MLNEYQDRIHEEISDVIQTIQDLLDVPQKNLTEQIVNLVSGTLEIGIPFLETCVEGYNECGGMDRTLTDVSKSLSSKLDLLIDTDDVPQKLQIAKDMLVIALSVNLNKLKEEVQAA